MGLFSGDYETIDIATARRLPLWETAYDIFKSNPINGIGPRGFRYVFHNYAQPDSFWFNDLPQTHPHLLFLEIMTETGSIGIAGYFLFIFLVLKTLFFTKNNWGRFPLLLPVLIAILPINAHMAFYGSIWSTMTWWLTAVYFAFVRLQTNEAKIQN
jgi:O-antigen ligase